MTQIFTNPKRQAPTSDDSGDLGSVIQRIADAVGDLQRVATRFLPSRYSLEIDNDELVLVDTIGGRRGRIAVTWEEVN